MNRPQLSRRSWILVALAAAFALRVAAQAIQWRSEVGWLPAFDAWQSGAVPYRGLLVSQLLILVIQVACIAAAFAGRLNARRPIPQLVGTLGVAYFGFMVFRLVAGQTFLAGDDWFDVPLPTIFHLVLASFVLLVARIMTTEASPPGSGDSPTAG